MIDIEQLLDLEVPGAVRISPSGKKVVYTTSLSLGHRKGENATSSIWIADVGKKHSARQLTSGLYNDKSPRWSPDSESIAFISDRAKAGKSSALYSLSLQGGEPVALTNADNERPIGTFAWSPDGKWIAFTSADEKSAEKKKREEEKDDVQVYGEEWDFNRLRLLHASTKTVTTLYGKDRHALDLTWNESGSSIAFMTQKTPELESGWVDGLDLQQASPVTKEASKICDLPGLSLSQWRGTGLHWTGDRIYYIATVDPKYVTGSDALWYASVSKGECTKLAGGDVDCTAGINKVGNSLVLKFNVGLKDELRTLDDKVLFSEMADLKAWHAIQPPESADPVFAVVKGDVSHPTEVFSFTDAANAVQLSNHGHAFSEPLGTPKAISVRSSDDKEDIDGLFITPASTSSSQKSYPTVVLIHGGPYSRITVAFTPEYGWGALLLSAGYAVLYPNYRGSSSRGQRYASYVYHAVGTADYDDVITLTSHCIEAGLTDPKRIVAGGWSQGGFLSYLASTRNGAHGQGWKFRGTICGAGVTDWDMMAMSSDVPSFESEMGQSPWRVGGDDTTARRGSAVYEMKEAAEEKRIPPVLILHGEKDARVPITQAWAFHRGCLKYKLPCEMVTYPREPHLFAERKHLVDMFQRVKRFVDMHLS